MYNVLILEIHTHYAIGLCDDGQMIRIKLKEGLNVGDKVYVLEEDIIPSKDNELPFYQTPMFKRGFVAFALILLCVFVWQSSFTPIYATLSIDGVGSIQLTVDRNGIIQDVQSLDNTYTEKQCNAMIGKSIQDIDFNDPSLIGAAAHKDNLDEEFKQLLQDTFGPNTPIAYGNSDDIEKAKEANTSLGAYLIDTEDQSDVIEDLFEDHSLEELQQFVEDNPQLEDHPVINDIIEDKIEDLAEDNESYDYDTDDYNDSDTSDNINQDDDNDEVNECDEDSEESNDEISKEDDNDEEEVDD